MARMHGNVDLSRITIDGVPVNLLGIVSDVTTLLADLATAQADIITLQNDLALKLGKEVFIAEDEKPNGTDGGASVVGVQTRVLNTVRINTITGASLAANQITLPAGTYRIRATGPTRAAGRNKIFLYNVTDAANAIIGTSENSAANVQSQAFLYGRITIAAPKIFELRHYTLTAVALNGLGGQSAAGLVEIYSTIQIFKE